MDASVICSIISAASAICVAIISAINIRRIRENEKREKRRQQESVLNLQMTFATMELATATATCCNDICGGSNNANVKKAWEKAEKAAEAYTVFERQILAEEIS